MAVRKNALQRAERIKAWQERRFMRLPMASSQIDEGPGRMRMPWFGQIGSQFLRPSE